MILMLLNPASLKLSEAITDVAVHPSIVITVDSGHDAAIYMVLIPSDVPNSRMNEFPKAIAIFESKIPNFSGTVEYLTISDTFLRLDFIFSDPAPRSFTVIDRVSVSNLFLIFSIIQTISGLVLFRKISETRLNKKGL